ncbi:MAG: hypothetical protein LBN41_05025 [Enterobacteriaceae bacterium]|jgi:hypothetical protein|nr:hypothetical protein [Enterobacteriaceae bacterium]
MRSENQQQAMNLIALLCLMYHLSPTDLEAIAHQLAHFDAVCDYRTQGINNVACH